MSREMRHSGIEWIGEIPKEWRVELIGNNIKEIKDKNEDSSEDNALQFKMGSIISKKGGDSKYNPESLAAYTKVQEGDIVINGLNLSFDFISQRVGLVRERGVITSTYLTLRPSSLLHSVFVNYLFKAYDNCKAFHGMGRGLRQILSYRELRNQKLIYPSLQEQQKIANYLDKVCGEVDEMIALQEQMIEELKAYKQSVITEAVTKGLNPNVPMKDSASREQNHACMNYAEAQPVFERKFKDSGIDWIGEIPEHWKVTVLRRFATIILGKMLQPNAKSDDDTLEQYICAKDVHFEGIDFSDLKKMYFDKNEKETYQVQKGDMLVVEGGAGAAGSCVLKTDLPDTYIQNSIMIVRPKQGIDIRYIQYFEFSLVKKGYVDFVCNKATIPHFTKDKLSSMPIPLPPLSEQQSIASYLDTKCEEIDALIAIKQTKIEELKEYKKSVIYEYVTGKKEVV